jgi:hypothetical protein
VNYYYIYLFALFFASALFLFAGISVLVFSEKYPEKMEKLPRAVLPGIIIAACDLAWCIPHSDPIAPLWMVNWLIPIAIAALWLSYQFLDYLFSRALGGLMILSAHFFLYASFSFHAPVKPLFSLFCYIMGLTGIFFCGKPHLLRDLIRKITGNPFWKYSAAAVLFVYFLLFMGVGISYVL